MQKPQYGIGHGDAPRRCILTSRSVVQWREGSQGPFYFRADSAIAIRSVPKTGRCNNEDGSLTLYVDMPISELHSS